MATPNKVTITLSTVEAEWLYEALADIFDSGSAGTWDENMANALADKLDQAKLGVKS